LHRAYKGVEIEKWLRKKCIRQFVRNVEKNVKSHSSPTLADLSTAENAGQRKETPEEDFKSS
jgi:hypothetical protein